MARNGLSFCPLSFGPSNFRVDNPATCLRIESSAMIQRSATYNRSILYRQSRLASCFAVSPPHVYSPDTARASLAQEIRFHPASRIICLNLEAFQQTRCGSEERLKLIRAEKTSTSEPSPYGHSVKKACHRREAEQETRRNFCFHDPREGGKPRDTILNLNARHAKLVL